jgi:glyoxylase-like metal-dependent hydrolase (beta-lactamase superfamily II)
MLAFWRGAGMPADTLAQRAETRPYNFADSVHRLPLGYRRIVQGEEIAAGGRRWRVEIGHGHAPEQATLWGVGHDLVLTGDQVLPGITPNLGVTATEPGADPVGEWLAACRRLAPLAGSEHFALPGHRQPFFGLDVRLAELADHQEESLDRLEAFLAEPRTATACFEVLFGRRIPEAIYGLALGEAVAHLNRLHATGRATRTAGPDGAWLWRRSDFAPDSAGASG